jgi:hypothetical protein
MAKQFLRSKGFFKGYKFTEDIMPGKDIKL